MKVRHPGASSRRHDSLLSRLAFAIFAGAIIVIVAGHFLNLSRKEPVPVGAAGGTGLSVEARAGRPTRRARDFSSHRQAQPEKKETAQEMVANKVVKFGRIRREVVHALAKRRNLPVPDDVERFFAALEAGNWDEVDAAHRALLHEEGNLNQPRSEELYGIWRPIQEAWGAAREAHNWPAQSLLDYGNAILDSLSPGMIYAGGTDAGCFIPTMLNETGEIEPRILLTQNALADMTYLNYLEFLYGDRMATLTAEDSQRAFQDYLADAQKRLQHDLQNPNEPKQIKPGEDVRIVDNAVQVSGQVAVMAINERLFQRLMDRNPGAGFAMEESFPLASLYSDATALGPIMELRAGEGQGLTAERAAESVDYWRTAAQQLISDSDTPEGSDARKAYAKLISSQAGLFQDHNFSAAAEQAYQVATEICPGSPEAVFRYVNLLLTQSRVDDALPIAENAVRIAPDNEQFQDLLKRLKESAYAQGRSGWSPNGK